MPNLTALWGWLLLQRHGLLKRVLGINKILQQPLSLVDASNGPHRDPDVQSWPIEPMKLKTDSVLTLD
jgi:hypothetical protein